MQSGYALTMVYFVSKSKLFLREYLCIDRVCHVDKQMVATELRLDQILR